MAAKTVSARYVGAAPARLDPQGIDLVPGETVVVLDAATVEANAIWQKVTTKPENADADATKEDVVL